MLRLWWSVYNGGSFAISIRHNALDLLHGHQTLDQLTMLIKSVELIAIGIQEIYGTCNLQRGLRLWHLVTQCIRKLRLIAVKHNGHRGNHAK